MTVFGYVVISVDDDGCGSKANGVVDDGYNDFVLVFAH